MGVDVLEDSQTVVQIGRGHDVALDIVLEGTDVFLLLFVECLARLRDQMSVMEVFDSLFEADGDEKADDDGGDVVRSMDAWHELPPSRARSRVQARRSAAPAGWSVIQAQLSRGNESIRRVRNS